MAIEQRSEEFIRDEEYAKLKTRKALIQTNVQGWVDRATALHTASDPAGGADAGDRADIIALRDDFIAQLSTILGV